MSDIFHIDESETTITTIVEKLRKDVFLNEHIIREGTLFSVEEESE
jgi:hypothetical protein